MYSCFGPRLYLYLSHNEEQVTLFWGQENSTALRSWRLSAEGQDAKGKAGNDETKSKTAAKRGLAGDHWGVSAGYTPSGITLSHVQVNFLSSGKIVCFHQEIYGEATENLK